MYADEVAERLVIGLRQQTSRSLAHMACNDAGMGEGNLSLECLDILSRSALMRNLFIVHNDWRNMGGSLDRLSRAPFSDRCQYGVDGSRSRDAAFLQGGLDQIADRAPCPLACWQRPRPALSRRH